jgi:hypothetical protein
MIDYKVGQKVKIIGESYGKCYPMGHIGLIMEVSKTGVRVGPDTSGNNYKFVDLELSEESYVFKEGDLIEQTMNCSETIAGEQYIVAKRLNGASRLIVNEHDREYYRNHGSNKPIVVDTAESI